jgi:hypothetical protein
LLFENCNKAFEIRYATHLLFACFAARNIRNMKRIVFVLLLGLMLTHPAAFSQKGDTLQKPLHISGAVSVTNNGISIVPTFSLDKPAAIFNLSLSKSRLSFEPDIRFSLSGKPWSFLFWARYKLVTNKKFQLGAGTHLGLNFRRSVLPVNGDSTEVNIARRYLAGELYPRIAIAKNISVGIYYLYSHGLDAGTIGNTHFITLNTNFSHIKLSKEIFLKLNPQFYYLKLDKQDGFFFTSTLTLAKRNFPLSLSGTINKRFKSTITGSKSLIWNTSLIYSFGKKYSKI